MCYCIENYSKFHLKNVNKNLNITVLNFLTSFIGSFRLIMHNFFIKQNLDFRSTQYIGSMAIRRQTIRRLSIHLQMIRRKTIRRQLQSVDSYNPTTDDVRLGRWIVCCWIVCRWIVFRRIAVVPVYR
jgi:hypothetical protein